MKEIINKMISLKVKIPIRETIFPTQKKCRQVRGNDKVVLRMWASGDFCQKCERPSPSPRDNGQRAGMDTWEKRNVSGQGVSETHISASIR